LKKKKFDYSSAFMGRHQVVNDLKYFKIKFKPICLVFTILKVEFLNSLTPKWWNTNFHLFPINRNKEKAKNNKIAHA